MPDDKKTVANPETEDRPADTGSDKACPPLVDEYKKKSLELTIDSLKLYITIATFSFGGLLALYNTLKDPGLRILFYFSLAFFLLSVIMSMYVINTFINEVYNKSMDIKMKPLPAQNFAAIGLLVAGFVTGIAFIICQPPPHRSASSTLVIENGLIKASGSMASKFTINTDTLKKTKTFILELK